MKRLSDYFKLYHNDIDSVIFQVKQNNGNINLGLLQTGCFYGDQKYIRISKRHKTEVTYTIITINNEIRTFSEYTKNDSDIVRQITMIKYMALFDYGIIIEVPMNKDMSGIEETSKIKDIADDLSKEHHIVIKRQNTDYVVYKDGYLWCVGYSPQFIRELVNNKYYGMIDKNTSTDFTFNIMACSSCVEEQPKETKKKKSK